MSDASTALCGALVAVAGQPNTGKSTIFNALTGMHQEVGNWPGKTVEKKMGRTPKAEGGYTVVDLPGSYSLHAHSPEENIAVDFLRQNAPDVTVVVASALSPERTLAYALDILAMGRPVILALNMTDLAEANGLRFDADALSAGLGVPVVPLAAIRKEGVEPLRKVLAAVLEGKPRPSRLPAALADHLPSSMRDDLRDCLARLLEKGMKTDAAFSAVWRAAQGDAESLRVLDGSGAPCAARLLTEEGRESFRSARRHWLEDLVGRDGHRALTARNATAAWDRWLLHPFWGPCCMVVILLLTLTLGFSVGFPLASLTGTLFSLPEAHILGWGEHLPLLAAMGIGVWRGVGAVCTMLPFITVFYTIFAFLEDVGYMARAAFIMDRAMNRIGLNGKAFIPLLFAVPCNISGVVGCRTIDDPRERLLTILLVPLVPCTAKIVVMVSIASWLFTPSAAVLVVLALLCMNMLVLAAVSLLAGRVMPPQTRVRGLLMELPHFHRPNLRNISRYVWRNILSFLKKASTLIVAFSVVVWFLSYYPTAEMETSLLGRMGRALSPVGDFMGVDWRLMTSLLASGVSKEAVMATLGVLFNATTDQLPEMLRQSVSPASAVAFMCAQSLFITCVSTIGILYSEARSFKIMGAIFAYSLVLPVLVAAVAYRLALLL